VVSPRPPRADGQGDQRRASVIVGALADEWDITTLSWLPDIDKTGAGRWADRPSTLLRALALSMRYPLQVAYVQARLPKHLERQITQPGYDRVLFVTTRAVPPSVPEGFVIDFVDDLGGAALRRAESARGAGARFWSWEGRRMRALDRRIAARARAAVACSPSDAQAISPAVRVVPLAVATERVPDEGDNVVFLGNLFYAPNHEAAMWCCDELSPRLAARGVDRGRLVIAGRRPRPALRNSARAGGVDLRADVEDLSEVFREAAVVVAPMRLGSGIQNKILDAVGAGRACVITPMANAGLDLVDGESAFVRRRDADEFAEAVVALLGDPMLRASIAEAARARLSRFMPESVRAAWREAVR
jgi:glycosyltransferase involved in cell wall biosynthesis